MSQNAFSFIDRKGKALLLKKPFYVKALMILLFAGCSFYSCGQRFFQKKILKNAQRLKVLDNLYM